METFNLLRDPTTGDENDPPGYRATSAQLASLCGASRTAMTVYDLPPGQPGYPDSDKDGVWGRDNESLDHVVRCCPHLDYWDGERP